MDKVIHKEKPGNIRGCAVFSKKRRKNVGQNGYGYPQKVILQGGQPYFIHFFGG